MQTVGQVLVEVDLILEIPLKIKRIFKKYGLTRYILFTYLTNAAVKNAEHSRGKDSNALLTIDRALNSLKMLTDKLSEDGEASMLFVEWHQAYPRFLQLMEDHPKQACMWLMHFMWIQQTEGITGASWGQYRNYDHRVRKQATRSNFDPSQVQEVLMTKARIAWQAEQAT
jgi:hypothetical protein